MSKHAEQIAVHEDLLLQIQQAEETALKLARRGVKLNNTILRLRDAAREVEGRIKYYKRPEGEPKKKSAGPKAPPTGKPESSDAAN